MKTAQVMRLLQISRPTVTHYRERGYLKATRWPISYKDRPSRVAFDIFSYLFQRFGTKIVVVSEIGNPKLDSEEVFEEIMSLLHCYSMKLDNRRKRPLVQQLVEVGGE